MPGATQLTFDQEETIRRRRGGGEQLRSIAQEFHISPYRVRRICGEEKHFERKIAEPAAPPARFDSAGPTFEELLVQLMDTLLAIRARALADAA